MRPMIDWPQSHAPGGMPAARIALALTLACVLAGALAGPAQAERVTFRYGPAQAGQGVYVAGTFNNWSPTADRMEDPDGDGIFETTLNLDPGTYQYKFVVEGNWITDETAREFTDDGYGGKNSVLEVPEGRSLIVGTGTTAPPLGATSESGQPAAGGEGAAGTATEGAGAAGAVKGAGAPAGRGAQAAESGQIIFRHQPQGPVTQGVFLAGTFNNWSPTATRLQDPDGDGVYETTVALEDGRHQYKFVVDGNWLTDESAAEFTDDGYGGRNSVLVVSGGQVAGGGAGGPGGAGTLGGGAGARAGDPGGAATDGQPGTSSQAEVPVTFRFQPVIGGARDVFVAGSFNEWNPSRDRLTDEDGDGTFEAVVKLKPGRHEYKFVVGGAWMTDEGAQEFNDDGFGGKNSVVVVTEQGVDLSAPRDAEGLFRVEFTYQPPSRPDNIYLAGKFNEWSTSSTAMSDPDNDGTYSAVLVLPGGQYPYKFVVDGNWTEDPQATLKAPDGFGGNNSVVEVDSRYPKVARDKGDGEIFTDGITHGNTLAERNMVSEREVVFRVRSYRDDVESVQLITKFESAWQSNLMRVISQDTAFDHLEGSVASDDPLGRLEYLFLYQDGGTRLFLGSNGFQQTQDEAEPFLFDPAKAERLEIPDWIRDGVIYQIFPDRFFNGDKSNDPDFSQWYYEGKTRLPRVGKYDGEYFHLVKDWYDIAGLTQSPYRSDGKPDWYSFYGGDIQGVMDKLPYLQDLGITVIYFNPVFQARSNHKYDTADYQKIDPAFGHVELFRELVDKAHAAGIHVILDVVFNHTGDAFWAFKDGVDKGPDSEYWNWYEWKKWPLPKEGEYRAADYYECWWDFGDLPDLNFDLANTKVRENGIRDIEEADPNQPMIDHLLESTRFWLTELDVDGFRLDVPNEVPIWFWEMFAAEVKRIKPDAYIVSELWGDASEWVRPGLVDATMNYRFFKDPVVKWMAQGQGSASLFDGELAPGRFVYVPQAQQAMMNLIGSHDTVRFRTQAGGDLRRLKLAALFQMSYVGVPHIYYGDEVGLEGGADPDCRRTFPWNYTDSADRAEVREFYKKLISIRKGSAALRRGDYTTLLAEGQTLAFARSGPSPAVVVAINNADRPATLEIPLEKINLGSGTSFEDLLQGGTVKAEDGVLTVPLGPVSGTILEMR